jgi:glycosyltransferase 2 family protein
VPISAAPAGGDSSDQGRRRAVRAIRVGGVVIALIAVGLCARTLANQWSEVSDAIASARIGWLVVAFLASAASMIGLGLLWWRCFAVFGTHVPAGHAVSWYFGGELGKYLPGGVWQIVGRGELARRAGVRRSTGYSTTLISYAAMCVGAATTCGLLAAPAAWAGSSLGWAWLLLLLIPAGLIVVHPVVFGRILQLGSRLTKGRLDLEPPPWPTMVGLIACSIPAWFFLGLASVAVTAALGFDQHPARIAFAAIAAWILGFLAVPIPAGAGVRELIFVALSGLESGPGVAVAAIARLLLIIVDGLGGLLGLWFSRRLLRPASPARSIRDPDRAG